MNPESLYKQGFTLIELVVVVTAILIVSGGTLAAYNDFSNKKKLEAAKLKVMDTIELAKNKASTGDTSMCSAPGVTPKVSSYTVAITAPTQFSLVPTCLTGTPVPYTYPTLPSGVTFNSSVSIVFPPLNAAVTPACVQIQTTSETNYISIQSTGLMEEVSAPTPCP